MPRLLLALLLTLSLWPSLAAGEGVRAHEPGSSIRAAQEHGVKPVARMGLGALGGWQQLPRLDTGLPTLERDGRHRTSTDAGYAPPTAAVSPHRATHAEAALLAFGVLLVRFEHLPYFATAPPLL